MISRLSADDLSSLHLVRSGRPPPRHFGLIWVTSCANATSHNHSKLLSPQIRTPGYRSLWPRPDRGTKIIRCVRRTFLPAGPRWPKVLHVPFCRAMNPSRASTSPTQLPARVICQHNRPRVEESRSAAAPTTFQRRGFVLRLFRRPRGHALHPLPYLGTRVPPMVGRVRVTTAPGGLCTVDGPDARQWPARRMGQPV